jgi:hypothetical protein
MSSQWEKHSSLTIEEMSEKAQNSEPRSKIPMPAVMGPDENVLASSQICGETTSEDRGCIWCCIHIGRI